MADIDISGNVDVRAVREEKKWIIDVRTFREHETKEVERWSWKKFRNEKWFVRNDCVNNKFKIRKLK